MPKIDSRFVDSTFCLYATASDAAAGREAQGTGFIVAHRWVSDEREAAVPHFYAVTNAHVASQFPVIRINRANAAPQILEFGAEDWEFHHGGDDLAVIALCRQDVAVAELSAVDTGSFVSEASFTTNASSFGVGDDVFMVGLFVDHEGIERNNPLLRFGNLSMLAKESSKVPRADGRRQLSFIVDMHSRTGYSGSPVFVYRTLGSNLVQDASALVQVEMLGQTALHPQLLASGMLRVRPFNMFALLGVHWGQFKERYEVRGGNVNRSDESNVRPYALGSSGMSLVVPAWRILDILNASKLLKLREQDGVRILPEFASGLSKDGQQSNP